jgi:uncharacterized membrane protein YecN with MAPEG domain
MELPTLLNITPPYIAVLGILFLAFTLRVGMYRVKAKILIGTGDDPELLRRTRGQANFTETVPMALFLIITMEILGASDLWLHSLSVTLVLGRICHYAGLTEIAPVLFRMLGMGATIATILASSIWILAHTL